MTPRPKLSARALRLTQHRRHSRRRGHARKVNGVCLRLLKTNSQESSIAKVKKNAQHVKRTRNSSKPTKSLSLRCKAIGPNNIAADKNKQTKDGTTNIPEYFKAHHNLTCRTGLPSCSTGPAARDTSPPEIEKKNGEQTEKTNTLKARHKIQLRHTNT